MNLYYLITELIIDAIALILGIVLIARKTDNLPQFYWGVIAALIGSVFIWENIGWVLMRSENPIYEYTDILNIEKMLKFYMLASLVSLYPLASLRPGYLTKFRVVTYLLTPIIITTIGICFLCFNGNITKLNSVSQIAGSIDNFDVRLRLVLFLFTIITPLLYFICPLIRNNSQRKANRMMFYFIGFMFLLLGIYVLFTLYICDAFFNGLGILSIAFSIFFSIQYLRAESPFSGYVDIKADDVEEGGQKHSGLMISPLFYLIENYLEETPVYTDSRYTIENLAAYFGENDTMISAAIKSGGYSGFREYINHWRLEYFRHQVLQNPQRSVKELMNISGFTSRSTFYRLYSEKYSETPTEYIEKQLTNK